MASSPGADVEVEPFLVQPPHDGTREKRLARVEDVGVGPEGGTPRPGPLTEVDFVDEIGGGAELLGEPGDLDPSDTDDTVGRTGDGRRPDLPVQVVEVGGRRGGVALGQHVCVTGPGGVCGTAHGCAASSVVSEVLRHSEVFGCVDAEQGQATGQHRPGGFGEREPGPVGGRGFLVAERQHGGEEGERGIGKGDEMPGEPVRGAVGGGAEEEAGVVGEDEKKRRRYVGYVGYVGYVDEITGVRGEAEVGGVTADGAGAGVGVTHPEEGLLSRWTRCSAPIRGRSCGAG